ncbi:MAG: peptidylprolyl isomerase [Clostridia bacterium]|nr:peptidylprolyl isomerase [Clostridia bacterium]
MKTKEKSKIVIIVAIVLVVAVAAFCVWYFGFNNSAEPAASIDEKSDATEKVDIAADNTEKLIADEEVVSGGQKKEVVEAFEEESDGVLMKVNGEPVDEGIFQFTMNNMAMQYIQSLVMSGAVSDVEKFDWNAKDPNYDGTYLEYVKDNAVAELVPLYALVAEGKRRGISLSEEDMQEVRNWVKEMQGEQTDEEFANFLKEGGCPSIDVFENQRAFAMLEEKVCMDFESNPEKYATKEQLTGASDGERVTVQHILIPFNPDGPQAGVTDEMKIAAKKLADEALNKVKGGGDFAEIAKEYTSDSQVQYTFGGDEITEKAFKDTAFALKVGEVSGVVEASYGYHIIKRIERAFVIDDYAMLLSKNAKVEISREALDKVVLTVDMKAFVDYITQNMNK